MSKNKLTPFGEALTALLAKRDMSEAALAKKLKIAQPNIHALKYKTANPRATTVNKISKALKVDPNYFDDIKWIETGKSVRTGELYLTVKRGNKSETFRLS